MKLVFENIYIVIWNVVFSKYLIWYFLYHYPLSFKTYRLKTSCTNYIPGKLSLERFQPLTFVTVHEEDLIPGHQTTWWSGPKLWFLTFLIIFHLPVDYTWKEKVYMSSERRDSLVKRANAWMRLIQKLVEFIVPLEDLLNICILYTRSMLEQSCQVWHSSLTLENFQVF